MITENPRPVLYHNDREYPSVTLIPDISLPYPSPGDGDRSFALLWCSRIGLSEVDVSQGIGEPTVDEILAALRSEEALQELLEAYDLTEDDVLARAQAASRQLTAFLDA